MTNGTRVSLACRPSNQSSFPEKASARRRAHVATGLGLLQTIGPSSLDGVWPGACRHRRASCAAGAGTPAVAGDRCVPSPDSRPRASTRASTRGGPTTCCRCGAPDAPFRNRISFITSAFDAVQEPVRFHARQQVSTPPQISSFGKSQSRFSVAGLRVRARRAVRSNRRLAAAL